MHILNPAHIDKSWTLFLDRDGVINKNRDNDYVKNWSEFEFIPGSVVAIGYFAGLFGKIVVVTNQQGIGKGLMTEDDLKKIHQLMLDQIQKGGGRLDKIYHCPDLAELQSPCRKPATGMALKAQKDFPEIDFKKSVMVGDSSKDMEFAARLSMHRFYVNGAEDKFEPKLTIPEVTNLASLASYIQQMRVGLAE